MEKFFLIGILVMMTAIGLALSSTIGPVHALSDTERYNSGYSHGYTDARNGVSSYCSTSEHTYTFCQGYNAGYQAGQAQTQQLPSPSQNPQSGYYLTVYVTSHPFGNAYSYVSITTADGYKDTKLAYSDQGSVVTFYVPPNEGSTVEVCISYYLLGPSNCQYYDVTGSDMTVDQDGPS